MPDIELSERAEEILAALWVSREQENEESLSAHPQG